MISYDEYLGSLGQAGKVFELIGVLLEGGYQSKAVFFKDPNLDRELIEKFKYCHNRFALTFVTHNTEFANAANPDIAYLFYRILQAHERFYREYLNNIKAAPQMIFDAINDIPNFLKPLMDYFKQYVPDLEKYQEQNTENIDHYLTSIESEKNNGGYFNNILDSFLPDMPKHRKYALILGQTSFALNDPSAYDQIFSPKKDQQAGLVAGTNAMFLDAYHSKTIDMLGLRQQKPTLQNDIKEEPNANEFSTNLRKNQGLFDQRVSNETANFNFDSKPLAIAQIDSTMVRSDGISSVNDGQPYVDKASIIIVDKDNHQLKIDNKGQQTVHIDNGKISGLVDDAIVIYNQRRLAPEKGNLEIMDFQNVANSRPHMMH